VSKLRKRNRKFEKSLKENEKHFETNVIQIKNFERKQKEISLIPKSVNQEKLLLELENDSKNIVVVVGPAGTGKTMLSTLWAIKAFRERRYDKIVISRPNVEVDDRGIGYLPGDIFSKMHPWMLPILDYFKEYYTNEQIELMMKMEIIEIVPLPFIRGRTFKNSVILIDESQNLTVNSIKSILTRIGENSKMILTGDIKQSDHGDRSGLYDFIKRIENKNPKFISIVNLDSKDVFRHESVAEILELYEK
jgi:phosphate starvation-inducible PhoH-like protein